MTKQIYHTTNWPQIVFAGAVQHTKECPRVKMGSVSPSCTNPSLVPSARAQDIRVSGLKEYRWSLAWVEQSHLSNLSILYGERSEPCTRVSFRVLLLCDLTTPLPPPPSISHCLTAAIKFSCCSYDEIGLLCFSSLALALSLLCTSM